MKDPNDIAKIQAENMARGLGVPAEELDALFAWLETGRRCNTAGAYISVGKMRRSPEASDWLERNDWA